jgi:hypothetical protein
MHRHRYATTRAAASLALAALLLGSPAAPGQSRTGSKKAPAARAAAQPGMKESMSKLEGELVAKYGEGQRERAARGLRQASALWKSEDGDAAAFDAFVRSNFAGDAATLDALFTRLERAFESLDGHMLEMVRDFRMHTDLDSGAILPFDEILAGYDPAAHATDDMFGNKLAFVVLLNFPLTTLEQRLAEGDGWTRRQWAEARLAERFSKRIPGEVNLEIARASAEADQYIAQYNVWMHHLLDESGRRLFPPKLRLLSHWNLRDEIKANYSAEPATALPKQRMIQKVMERIVTQTIPAAVVDNPTVDWNPYTNAVTASTVDDADGQGRGVRGSRPLPRSSRGGSTRTARSPRRASRRCSSRSSPRRSSHASPG